METKKENLKFEIIEEIRKHVGEKYTYYITCNYSNPEGYFYTLNRHPNDKDQAFVWRQGLDNNKGWIRLSFIESTKKFLTFPDVIEIIKESENC